MKKTFFLFFIILILASAALPAFAQDSSATLQKIIDYNKTSTLNFSVKISFFIAFIAGVLGILSPCILPFLPAYFSYTFKEKRNLTKMTLIFFLGFSTVFVAMGIIAGFLGEQVLSTIQKPWLAILAGLYMVILGAITIKGKKVCSYLKAENRCGNDNYGTFLFGMSFALGWTACLGPVLAGILGIGAVLGNVTQSAMLMAFYSLGNLVPLFIISILYDKYDLSKSKLMHGKILKFKIDDDEYYINSTNLISGALLILTGLAIIAYKGTSVFNRTDPFGTKQYFYLMQNELLAWHYANILGIIAFVIFVLMVLFILIKKSRNHAP